ncbi:DUF4365 domain-containing protein [Streptomyces sp. SID1328]|nr:DUF4365 domain-containing protein [Streptomyces sp. SID1328]MYV40192.1 DUF4365 domain-containing protein [Streptomyces sp. SID1328]
MRGSEQEQTGGAGVSRVIADFTDLGWGPVENTRHDLGIDLFLQVRDERRFDRIILMAAQVKSGPSYFGAPTSDDQGTCTGWWYAESDARHFEDWVQHALPHLLVMHDDATRTSYWAHVTKEAVQSTGDGFKIHVPIHQKVEPSSRDTLLEVATSAKQQPVLQGTSFAAGARAVAPGRALRHALLTPRLIAPHRNTSFERTLAPEEAIALVTQGRVQDLKWYIEKGSNPQLAGADSRSRLWEWRFFSAYHDAVVDSNFQPLLDLARDACPAPPTPGERKRKPEQTHRIAASVVTGAAFLTATERLEEAEALLEAAGEDLLPIDQAWVLIHRAIVMSEQGDLDTSRRLAAEAQRSVALDLDDVTATAIGASAADFLFRTSGLEAKDLGATMTAVDTAASWWRSQTVAWALEEHEEKAFRAWGECEDPGTWPSEEAQNRLLSAWLSASLAGTRGPAAAALAQHARHEVIQHEAAWRNDAAVELSVQHSQPGQVPTGPHARGLEDTLDELRRYGCTKTLQIAVQRLWAAGPASPVQAAVQRSVTAPWTHTNAPTKLALLRHAGDLLPPELADQAGRHCLALLADPAPFAQRVRPTFSIDHYAHRALWRVLPAATDAFHAEAADMLLRILPDRPGEPAETDLINLATLLRPSAVAAFSDHLRAAATGHSNPSMSAALLGVLIASGDSTAEAELLRRTEAGDIDAIGEVRSPADLSPSAGQRVIDLAETHCQQQLDDAHQNSWGLGGWDWARLLALCNFFFPEHARWDSVIDIVLDPQVAQEHKAGAVRALTTRADQLPAPAATRLRAGFETGLPRIRGVAGLIGEAGDLTEAAFALGLALGAIDSTTALHRILTWLRGSASQRRSAAHLVTALSHHTDDPVIQGTLVALTGDPQYQVRAAAAFSLTRGLQENPTPAVEAAIATAAHEPGCRVPLAIAHALDHLSALETHRTLRNALRQHMSALVRSAATPTSSPPSTTNTPHPATTP